MLLLGIDLGTSSVKASVVDSETKAVLVSAQYPETEVDIIALHPGWAEQSPELWWEHVKQAIFKCNATGKYDPKEIDAIGIAYQMHGLVVVDKSQDVLRNSIIWCDGRAVEIGNNAFDKIGHQHCLSHLLNSPGNFTASKLYWVKENEPEVYSKINKAMLPGDFISMKFTGEITTSISALSEGIFWDFKNGTLSKEVMEYFGFDYSITPEIRPVFSEHGKLDKTVASRLSLKAGIPVSYKAGDQPNNAFSLNVLNPGEVAATAGTSGVIYGVTDKLNYDPQSRVNGFAHVNHEKNHTHIGVLLCINGCGIFNRWMKNIVGPQLGYDSLNTSASHIPAGSDGLLMLPFGNGAERILKNRIPGGSIHNLDFNVHTSDHLVRATQEGIAFAFRYGLDIMRENGMAPTVIRAGKANMFLSDVFTSSFVNSTGVSVELYDTDGSVGAALGAAVGTGYFKDASEALCGRPQLKLIEPTHTGTYESLYQQWKELLHAQVGRYEETSNKLSQDKHK